MRLLPHFLAATFLVGLGAAPLALQRNAFDQFQRYGGDQDRGYNTQSNERAEFTWSRLHYNDSGRRFGGFPARQLVDGLSEGRPAIPIRIQEADADRREADRADRRSR